MTDLSGLADVARQSWREDAACDGAKENFVDIDTLAAAEFLLHRYCGRCPVVAECDAWASTLRPQKWLSVYGARVHGIASARKRQAS